MKSYEIGIEDPERDDRTDQDRALLMLRYLSSLARMKGEQAAPSDGDDIG